MHACGVVTPWFLGIRYALQMLPVLLFEIAWKLIWMTVVVLPLWLTISWIRPQ